MASELALVERQLFTLGPSFDQVLRPIGIPAERIIRSVVIQCERTPRLLECTLPSILQAATTGAILGLEADGHTGQGFLIPFRDKGTLKAQWQTGYKGFVTLGARVGLTIDGAVVREGDAFDFQEGSDAFVKHKKAPGSRGQRIVWAWACATAPGRTPIVKVLDIDEIRDVMARSPAVKAGQQTPWRDEAIGFPAMAEKTAKRRLARSLPLSVYQMAARIDEAHEEQGKHAFLHPEKGIVIDAVAEPVGIVQPDATSDMLAELPAGPAFYVLSAPPSGERRRFPTIEAWRGFFEDIVPRMSRREGIEHLRDANAKNFDDYSRQYVSEVNAVVALIDGRLRRL